MTALSYGSLMYQYLYNIKHILELTLNTEFSEMQCLRMIKVQVFFGALVWARTSLTSKTSGFEKAMFISSHHNTTTDDSKSFSEACFESLQVPILKCIRGLR